MERSLDTFLHIFYKISKKPYEFLSIQENLSEDIKVLIKNIYDYTKNEEEYGSKSTLPKLIIENFDDEQIWQELELQNNFVSNDSVQKVSQLSAKQEKLKFPLQLKFNKSKINNVNESVHSKNEEEIDDIVDEDCVSLDEEDDLEENHDDGGKSGSEFEKGDASERNNNNTAKRGNLKPSVVDDKFFKLAELELYLQNEERNQDKTLKDGDTIDLFGIIDDEPVEYKYSDFFENPNEEGNTSNNEEMEDEGVSKESDSEEGENSGEKLKKIRPKDDVGLNTDSEVSDADEKMESEEESNEEKKEENVKKVRFSLLGSDDEDEDFSVKESTKNNSNLSKTDKNDNKIKSSFEQRQERLGKVIDKLEEEALSEKPWQLKGEVTANTRPQNSLLEEPVDFDISVRPAPIMTEKVTMKLEEIIMQRIKDKAWDDVERKIKPVDNPSEFKKKLALDQEKSKLSLAEVYEQEFMKQRDAATADDVERQEVEPALHVEVRSMLHSLFNKLDALSNYHYTPRPVAPELKVVSNVPAINMEEVAPVTVADSALLAPEEVKGKKRKGELMSKEERTETDKKRARRLKKTKQRQRARERARVANEVTKLNPGLGNKYTKLKAVKQVLESSNNITKMKESRDKMVKSSTSFFNKLQDEVKSQIKSKTSSTFAKKDKANITAKKLKL